MLAPLHRPGPSPMKGGARASGCCRRPVTPLTARRPCGTSQNVPLHEIPSSTLLPGFVLNSLGISTRRSQPRTE
jgi:hypothetical protein